MLDEIGRQRVESERGVHRSKWMVSADLILAGNMIEAIVIHFDDRRLKFGVRFPLEA